MATQPVAMAQLAVGNVIKLSKMGLQQVPCVQLRCRQMDFSEHLRTYFMKYTDVWALDAEAKARMGDIVLIRGADPKEQKTTSDVRHEVERVIFKYGCVIDPVTKKRSIGDQWAGNLALKKRLVDEIVEAPRNATELYAEQRQLQKKLIKDLTQTNDSTSTTSSSSFSS